MAAAVFATSFPCFFSSPRIYESERRGVSATSTASAPTSCSTSSLGENHGRAAISSVNQEKGQSFTPSSTGKFYYILQKCIQNEDTALGEDVYAKIVENGLITDSFIGCHLIRMVSTFGDLTKANEVFEELREPSVYAWSAIISAHSNLGSTDCAMDLYFRMRTSASEPDGHAFVAVLQACALTASLVHGTLVHHDIIETGYESCIHVNNTLVDIHASRIEEGCRHFKSIRERYGVLPTLEHYYSMVELLGHGSHFDEAEDLMESVPFRSTIVGWTSLLAASRRHGNVKLGKRCFEHAVSINPGYSAEYKLMWSLYTGAGLMDDAEKVEELRISANAWKKPAKAFIEVDNHVHCFIVGDKTHPQSGGIYAKLESLSVELKNEGCSPSTGFVPKWGLGKEAEDEGLVHSEKLAIAFGLISTAEGSTIRLSKNLRVCSDCHAAAKAISKVEMRDIIISDAYQIHHFHDGACSCVNFW
ncbi:hypothetical protein GOP47_0028192 [Adiantum capillus-veneris]|nr:hypothetical protein GOP47_0028192 [Adiantum capillus-veneris]